MFDFGRRFAPDAKIIQIDIEAEEIGLNRAVDVGTVGDAGQALGQILDELDGRTDGLRDRAEEIPWLTALREKAASNAESIQPFMEADTKPIRAYRLLNEVRRVFPRDTIYSVDGQAGPAVEHAREQAQLGRERLHGRGRPVRHRRRAPRPGHLLQ